MAKILEYKIICSHDINVNGIRRVVGEVFSEEETKEIKTLVARKYIATTGGK